jgi:hypothetical protein
MKTRIEMRQFIFQGTVAPFKAGDTAILDGPCSLGEAIAAFDIIRKKQKEYGFRVRNNSPMAGTARRCEIVNPITGNTECVYTVVPTS